MKKLLNTIRFSTPFLKFDLKMKLTTLFLLTTLTVMHAGVSYSQKAKVSFSANNMSVAKVIEKLEFTTEYRFVYNVRSVDLDRKIDINLDNASIETILSTIFNNSSTDYKVSGNHIILTPKKLDEKTASVKKAAADFIVKGRVTDEKGMPLAGAAVSDNGSGRGVQTDFNGEFQIITVSSETTLAFAYLGYIRQEIKVEGRSVINVVLKEDTLELGEIVITTGYQNINKEQVTGAVSTLKTTDYQEQRLSGLDKILEGRVVGYQNGKIRGTTTMTGLSTPLYVIDGFPVENTKLTPYASIEENLPSLNLEDIETITVLKDAAASSIYGARAANGVVVITTKKAKAGKTNISFSSNLTITPYRNYTGNLTDSADIIGLERGWAAGNPNLQGANAGTYSQSLLNNAVFTSLGMQTILKGYAGVTSQTEANNTLNTLAGQGYKYYDDVAKYAKRDQYFMQHNISLGKATDYNTFNASLTYKDNQLEDRYSENQTVGLNLKNSTQINSWLSLDLGSYTNFGKGDTQSYMPSNPITSSVNPGYKYQPYNQLVNNDGTNFVSTAASRYNNYTLQSMQTYGLYNMDITPMDELGRNLLENKNFLNRTFAKFNVKFSNAFTYNAMFQYEYGSDRASQLLSKDSYYVRNKVNSMVTIANNKAVYNLPYGDIIQETNHFSNAYNFRQQLNYNQIFAKKHDFSAIAGMEIRHAKQEFSTNTRYGYDDQTLGFAPINQADLLKVYGTVFNGYMLQNEFSLEKELQNRYVSVYATGGYTYDRRYSLSGSVRWDRSNLWGTDSKYQNKPIWSTGAAWNIDKESFFESEWVDALKLRVSYGIGGNIAKDSAPYLTAYYDSNSNVGGNQGTVNKRPNPELSWEKTTTTNIGFDFSFFKSRLSGTLDFYNKKGEDLLASSQGIPTEGWGYSTYYINNGEMTNKGIETTLRGTIVKTPSFSWDASVLYAYNKNKVDYVNVKAPVYYLQLDHSESFPRVGTSYNAIYGYKWAGLSATGIPQVYDASGTAVKYNPGQLDAIYDFGSTVPLHSGSFHTAVNYKNFSLSALFIYELGHKVKNTFLPMLNNNYNGAAGGYVTDISVVNNHIADRWMQPGDEAFTNIPRAVYEYDPEFNSDSRTIYSYADINILDASNVRLSNISLAYQMPKDLIKRVKLDGVRFNLNAENVYTFAKSRDAKFMLNGFQSPSFVFGVNVNF
ncbi:SusC/RagA family TonB-linked outer membrane protein [Flavobacterium hungaricum]|uniref:SusC/RagA family TonB-linked outer membrane protein n=1 Tax=Flavobacterium hungaricum TaxID=2082725 RepID=A0ABR9TDB4_9FLAO|nr:SusC/RagA family TonB-linked outer membrane protein [Flavobacterium hungaricum]MBE8723341.1 SusC/RagA family TonB-linked outer membrane protein [Flavobacterium hungaricum]